MKNSNEHRIEKENQVNDNQFGFMFWRSIIEENYMLRYVMKRYQMDQQDLHLIFVDLEKAYDRVSRDIFVKSLREETS